MYVTRDKRHIITAQLIVMNPSQCSRIQWLLSLALHRYYLFQVRARNQAGAGPWSDILEVVSGAGVPDAPKAPVVECRGPSSAALEWEEPLNNGATIEEYRLEWRPASHDDYSLVSSALSLSLPLPLALQQCFV